MATERHLPLRIWIDLANSPEVLFFHPIVEDLRASGHTVELTARRFAQTVDLADLFSLDATPIGGHGGGKPLRKIANTFRRAWALRRFGNSKRFDLAISYNSYAHCLAAWSLRIPTVTSMDYEYQPANHLAFRLADLVVVPTTFSERMLRKCGASPNRTFRYEGLKEEIYLQDYSPDDRFLERLHAAAGRAGKQFAPEHVLVTFRPPATKAAYHRCDNPLFADALRFLAKFPHARLLVAPRGMQEKAELAPLLPDNAFIPDETLDGRHLVYSSDLLIGAGGTMNREAVVLGTPVYSIFAGRIGGVDQNLIKSGQMTLVRSREDFATIRVEKKSMYRSQFGFRLRSIFTEKCLELAYGRPKKGKQKP